MFFQAGVTYPFLACFAGWLVFARSEEPLFRRLRLLLGHHARGGAVSVLLDVQGLSKTFGDAAVRLGPRRPPVKAVDSSAMVCTPSKLL